VITRGSVMADKPRPSPSWPTVVTVFLIVLSVGVSLAGGLSSGIYPALRAAELDPIEALRYE
jgi:putative ABC transport system permease protein